LPEDPGLHSGRATLGPVSCPERSPRAARTARQPEGHAHLPSASRADPTGVPDGADLSVLLASAPTGISVYTFTLGLVAAVNPCGFPILPVYLTLSSADGAGGPLALRVLRAVASGLAVTVGFVLVFGLFGLAAKTGLLVAEGWLPWVNVPVGALCLVVGVLALAGRSPTLHLPTRRLLAGRRRSLALVGFGVTYAIASIGCALPIFISGVVETFGQSGVAAGLVAGLTYALGMGLVIIAVSLAGLGAQQMRLRHLRAAQPILQRVAGGVLAVVGAYLVFYWVSGVVSPLSTPAPVRVADTIQNAVRSWLSASPRTTGLVIGLLVVAVLGASCVHLFRHGLPESRAEETPPPHPAPTEPTASGQRR